MAEYKQINCACGYSYPSKEMSSRCPSCNKQNWSLEFIGVMILIVVALVILLGLMFGAFAYALYLFLNSKDFNSKNIKWHFLGVLTLSICSLKWFNDIYSLSEFPIMSWITYLTNCSAILVILYHFLKLRKSTGLNDVGVKKFQKQQNKKISKEIKFAKASECSTIIQPKVSDKGIVTFRDLEGNRVTKIPAYKRDIAVSNKCYLGLKKFKNSERWVPIKPSEVINSK
tara:strand:- start:189 stop:872 length:684 start_codon:yes stop_codon:yes gene_type:complete